MAKTDGVARIIALAALGKNGGGSAGGTTNYLDLANKPKINNVELTGNKTLEDLGINIPDLENYYTKEEINNTFSTTKDVKEAFAVTWESTKNYIDSSSCYDYTTLIEVPSGRKNDDRTTVRFPVSGYNELCKQYGKFLPIKLHLGWVFYKGSTMVYPSIDNGALKLTGTYNDGDISVTIRINGDKIQDAVVGELQDFDFWIMSSLKVTYTAGSNISISNDNVISANVSGGTDSSAVYTYYAPYSDEDWFTEENVANILQTVKDKGYSNFEMCTLNGSHYALRKGGNLQNLTIEGENYELEYLQNDLKNYVYYFFVARLNESGKIVVDGLGTQTYTAQETIEAHLPETLQKMSGYDGSASHLILQSNNGNFEWDSSLDGGIFGDNYTDPAYYTEKQVDKIVTDTVNEALGGRY
jgi:hypothetical protein